MEQSPREEDLETWDIVVGHCFLFHRVREKLPREQTDTHSIRVAAGA